MSPVVTISPASQAAANKEAAAARWRPDTISDEQLLALHRRLERLHERGDAFADVSLSPIAMDRLGHLLNRD